LIHFYKRERRTNLSERMVFEGAGQEEGLQIWRIENFEPVPYDENLYGKFNVGDSYIILATLKSGDTFSWNVHFWLGSETTQDESGSAAILAVELDDSLDGVPVQYREVQEAESQLFLSYFKKGVRYLAGGVKSGFKHYDPDDVVKRLFMVKGKKNIQVKEVMVDITSMNNSDSFILDCGKGHDIFVYLPPKSRKLEQFRATQVANEIRDEDHAGHAEVIVVDQYSDNQDKFFEALGSGSQDEVPEGFVVDEDAEKAGALEIKLFKVHCEDGSGPTVIEVSARPLRQDMLDTKDAFILFGGTDGLFAWIGKESNKEERLAVMKAAETYIDDNGLARATRVTRVIEGIETAMFKQFFTHWNEVGCTSCGLGRTYSPGSIAEWNIEDLHAESRKRIAKSGGTAIGFMPDEGTGTKKIWRVEDMELVELEDEKYGFFFAGDSYVILYQYGPESIVYFWQGSKSSIDEKGASAIHAARIDTEETGGKAIQIRVVQGEEPRHFIKMFSGKMVVFAGGKASGFNNVKDRDEYDEDGVRMFRVRSTCGEVDARAAQVPETADSLASDDVFLLETPENCWIWAGQESVEEEVEQAQRLAALLCPGREVVLIKESEEEDSFWTALGGPPTSDYRATKAGLNRPILPPRLFHIVSRPNGKVRAFEIFNFKQSDLSDDDAMILDSGDEIYLWIGKDADKDEGAQALDLAKKYLDSDPTPRSAVSSTIITIKDGLEPKSFTSIFPDWN